MNFPAELKYSRDHEWVKMLDDTTALVGITDFAQDRKSTRLNSSHRLESRMPSSA